MRPRPQDDFIRKIRKEEPTDNIRKKLIRTFKDGGVTEFEKDLQEKMWDVSMSQVGLPVIKTTAGKLVPPTDPNLIKWIYVGECWWCRQRKQKTRIYYEFARMVAIYNRGERNEVEGLWDARRHAPKPPPVIVYDKNTKLRGFVVGYNHWELLVDWENSSAQRGGVLAAVRFVDVGFEFLEDYEFYKKVFKDKLCGTG